MKRLLHILAFVFVSTSIFSQIDIEANLTSDIKFKGEDLTDSILDLSVHIDLANIGDEMASLKWEILTPSETCMDEWGFYVCDNNFCYDEFTPTNYDPDGSGINFPSELNPGENYDFILHLKPYTVAGCCTVTINFYSIDDLDTVVETIEMEIHVNSTDCLELVATNDLYFKDIQLFPNPTNNRIQFSDVEKIHSVQLTDVFGKTHKNLQFQQGIDLSTFDNGIYFLTVRDKDNTSLKSFKVVKH